MAVTSQTPGLQTDSIQSLKAQLSGHRLYSLLTTPDALRCFMEHHVFCVWDFMSLVKSLQKDLTCTTVPWLPTPHPAFARLINEIVLDEESDEIEGLGVISHFELYIKAMEDIGANTNAIKALVQHLRSGESVNVSLQKAHAPQACQAFVHQTFQAIQQPLAVVANVFFHSREDLIPRMFFHMVASLHENGLPCQALLIYLERHLAVDTDKHGPLAHQLIEALNQTTTVPEAERHHWIEEGLRARLTLWDHLAEQIETLHQTAPQPA